MIPRPTRSIRASAMPAPTGIRNTGPATTSGRRACSRSAPATARSSGASSTRRTIPTTSTRSPSTRSSTPRSMAQDRKLVVHAARNGFYYVLDRVNGSFVARQAVRRPAELDDRPRSEDRPAAQLRSHQGRAGIRAAAATARAPIPRATASARRTSAARTGSPAPTIRISICSSSRRSRAATTLRDGRAEGLRGPGRPGQVARTVRRRRRPGRPSGCYGSLKAVDPVTGETKVRLKLDYPNYSGALATGRQPGLHSAISTARSRPMTPRRLKEVWSFNLGTGINAPPITYSVNGKQYVAVLVGSRSRQRLPTRPSSSTRATASMLYVFGRNRAQRHNVAGAASCRAGLRHIMKTCRHLQPPSPALCRDRRSGISRRPRSPARMRARSSWARRSTRSRPIASSATSGTARATRAMAAMRRRCARPSSRPSNLPTSSSAAGRPPACPITTSSPIPTSAAST